MKLKCPASIKLLLGQIKNSLKNILKDNLVGIYLHGSLPMGSFNIKTSDIDFLVVTEKPLTLKLKREIIGKLIELSDKAPAKGLEMSVVLLKDLKKFHYPTPFELHYSQNWKDDYLMGKLDLKTKRYDRDLASHFVKTKKRGFRLYGAPIKSTFPEIPHKVYMQSIMYDFDNIKQDILTNPVYGILNLCRTVKDLQDGTVSSKAEGGNWALKHLNPEFKSLIQQALAHYAGKGQKDKWSKKQLNGFADYALKEIELNGY